ncbi:acyl-CoA dehydrogenase family protein [Dietzia psychralcaliphila]|uniref:acyl-CoA dehydrogenase family protein n=1 Tax=Dietzia psychralcaliphila TaxID=139021 RepID=UPI001C1E44F1|nr:acyl-CoA dehydrogenase family protein [Dietzia psychralcaliphila]
MTATPAVASEFVALLTDVLGTHRPDPSRSGGGFDRPLWDLLDDLGLVRLSGSEAGGGSGAGWHDAVALHEQVAAHGIQLPLVEHDLLAGWVLERLGRPAPHGVLTLGQVDNDGIARGVPWAGVADQIVLIREDGSGNGTAQVLAPSEVTVSSGRNLAGEPRDVITDIGTAGGSALDIPVEVLRSLRHRAALIRAVQVCGALDAAVESTARHVSERIQFGRPLAKFQAVQHAVADAAAETALARAATQAAVDEAVAGDFLGHGLTVSIAAARSCAGHASSLVVRAAHQLHGALGTTREHSLHLVTVPALAWINEYGTVAEFDRVLTRAALAAESGPFQGHGGVWDLAVSS